MLHIKMDYRRYTINELARLTNTSKHLLYDWVRRGYLVPTQISGTRKKYSIDAFLRAEKLAREAASKSIAEAFVRKPTRNGRIPDEFFDNIERYI